MKETLRLKQEIIDYLVHFKLRIESNNRFDLYDVNKLSQGFIASLLNISTQDSNSNYIDLDKIKHNYPAIDIGCKNTQIAYQFTSQNNTSKIYDTILSFKEKYLDNDDFKSIRFLILNNLSWSKKQWKNIKDKFSDLGLEFDVKSILTIEQFEKNLAKLDNDSLNQFLDELKKEFGIIEHLKDDSKDENLIDDNDKLRKELMSRFYHIHISPWDYAESEEELEFKRILRNKDPKSCKFLAEGRHKEIIVLWQPLFKFDLYDINHPYWFDKPFIRRFIQSSKMDVCLARTALCTASTEKCDLNPAIKILREVLFAPTYSITGGSNTQLPTKAAMHENSETILFLNRMIEVFRKLIKMWMILLKERFNVDEHELESLIEKCEYKIKLIESVNK